MTPHSSIPALLPWRFGVIVPPCRSRRGLTLLEVLLSMGILVMLSSMTYWFYASALETRDRDTRSVQQLQLVRVILDRMADEIRQASVITAGHRVGIKGTADRLWLSTLRTPTKQRADLYVAGDELRDADTDLVRIEYRIARHPDVLNEDGDYPRALGLARVEHRTPRPAGLDSLGFLDQLLGIESGSESGEEDEVVSAEDQLLYDDEAGGAGVGLADEIPWEELYSTDIRYIRFCYFDGHRWWDDWEIFGENPLPQLVQVTIGFEERPPLDAEFGVRDEEAEEFCTCMNREPMDCVPLPPDQFTLAVRIPQADPLFRSRVGREMKSLIDESDAEQDPSADTSANAGGGTSKGSGGSKANRGGTN